MPKEVAKLTIKQVEAKLNNGETDFAVGGVKGLYCRNLNGKASFFLVWRQKEYKLSAKEKKYKPLAKLVYPIGTSLADAREKGIDDRRLIESGKDPRKERKRKNNPQQDETNATLKTVTEAFNEAGILGGTWKGRDKGKKEIQRFNSGVIPYLGERPINDITVEELCRFFSVNWKKTPSQARKLQQRLSQIFNWSIDMDKYGVRKNPASARGPLGKILKQLSEDAGHFPAPDYKRIPELIKDIFQLSSNNRPSASALLLVMEILTASRPEAIANMRWSNIDFKKKVWTIPAEYNKSSKEFRSKKRIRDIYLSNQAIDFLRRIPKHGHTDLVFVSREGFGKPLKSDAIVRFLKRLHEKKQAIDGIGWVDHYADETEGRRIIVPHGTARACFATWAEETHQHEQAADLCLLHEKKDDLRGAYKRSKFEAERYEIMQRWGEFCFQGINLDDIAPKCNSDD